MFHFNGNQHIVSVLAWLSSVYVMELHALIHIISTFAKNLSSQIGIDNVLLFWKLSYLHLSVRAAIQGK